MTSNPLKIRYLNWNTVLEQELIHKIVCVYRLYTFALENTKELLLYLPQPISAIDLEEQSRRSVLQRQLSWALERGLPDSSRPLLWRLSTVSQELGLSTILFGE